MVLKRDVGKDQWTKSGLKGIGMTLTGEQKPLTEEEKLQRFMEILKKGGVILALNPVPELQAGAATLVFVVVFVVVSGIAGNFISPSNNSEILERAAEVQDVNKETLKGTYRPITKGLSSDNE